MAKYFVFRVPLAAVIAVAVLTACGDQRAVSGACQPVFDGDVCTWGTMDGDEVVEFGATVPLATIENAPMQGDMVFPPVPNAVIALPDEVVQATGFDHFAVHWELHGHPPTLFLTPHFDFHFYTIKPDKVRSIDCADVRKPPRLPAEYSLPDVDIPGLGMLVGLCVPQMGMHGMPTKEIDETAPFGASMLVGYYEQAVIFLEPMISHAKLAEAKTIALAVPPLPQKIPAVRWPSRFEAVYEPEARKYRLVFAGLPSG